MRINVSNRCYLSEISFNDVDDLVAHLETKEVADTTLTIPFPYTKNHAYKFIADTIDSDKNFAIRNSEGKLIGHIGVRQSAIQKHIGILGYWLAKEYWNKGIMTEVVKAFTDFCMKKFRWDRITATCFEENIGSGRALEKAGFKFEGLMIKHYKKDEQFFNAKMYGKVDESERVLLMGTHWDGLNLPDGKKWYPHAHVWKVKKLRTSQDKLGRPYCIECQGMPSWYDLEEVSISSGTYKYGIESGSKIVVERDNE